MKEILQNRQEPRSCIGAGKAEPFVLHARCFRPNLYRLSRRAPAQQDGSFSRCFFSLMCSVTSDSVAVLLNVPSARCGAGHCP